MDGSIYYLRASQNEMTYPDCNDGYWLVFTDSSDALSWVKAWQTYVWNSNGYIPGDLNAEKSKIYAPNIVSPNVYYQSQKAYNTGVYAEITLNGTTYYAVDSYYGNGTVISFEDVSLYSASEASLYFPYFVEDGPGVDSWCELTVTNSSSVSGKIDITQVEDYYYDVYAKFTFTTDGFASPCWKNTGSFAMVDVGALNTLWTGRVTQSTTYLAQLRTASDISIQDTTYYYDSSWLSTLGTGSVTLSTSGTASLTIKSDNLYSETDGFKYIQLFLYDKNDTSYTCPIAIWEFTGSWSSTSFSISSTVRYLGFNYASGNENYLKEVYCTVESAS